MSNKANVGSIEKKHGVTKACGEVDMSGDFAVDVPAILVKIWRSGQFPFLGDPAHVCTDEEINAIGVEIARRVIALVPEKAKQRNAFLRLLLVGELGPEFNMNANYAKADTHDVRYKWGPVRHIRTTAFSLQLFSLLHFLKGLHPMRNSPQAQFQ